MESNMHDNNNLKTSMFCNIYPNLLQEDFNINAMKIYIKSGNPHIKNDYK